MVSLKKNIYPLLYWFIAIIILIFPTYKNIFFDGLVFNKVSEIIVIFFLVPFFLFFKIYKKKIVKGILSIMLVLKIILIFFPDQGILIEQFFILDNKEERITNTDRAFSTKK